MKKLYLDLETTGRYYWKHGIHQISGEIVLPNKAPVRFNCHVQPFKGDKINEEALKVSHKTIEDLKKHPKPQEVWEELYALFTSYVNPFDKRDKFYTYAYNSKFDEDFFRQFCKKLNFEFFGALFHSPFNCVMQKAFVVLGDKRPMLKNVKLATVAQYFQIPIEEDKLHDSAYDTRITVALDEKLDYVLKNVY